MTFIAFTEFIEQRKSSKVEHMMSSNRYILSDGVVKWNFY